MTRCVGHRGAAGLAPENTLAAFAAGIAAGADVVECDVHQTIDGRLVLMHDAEVSRTTDGKGPIGALTLDQLRRFNAAAKFGKGDFPVQRVPTLAELLALAKGRCGVQIEIKVPNGVPYSGIERQVVEALREQQGIETAQIISFDSETLARVHALEPRLELGYLASRSSLPPAMRRAPDALAEQARAAGCAVLGLDRQLVAPGHLRAARSHGLMLAVWTVNDPPEMQHLVQMGVDSITSDRPDVLRTVLDQHVQ